MAQNLSVALNILSVDNSGQLPTGTCYDENPSAFGRGKFTLTPTINISINDNNVASFGWGGYTGSSTWYVCSTNGYHLDVQFSIDGVNWTNISSAFVNNAATQSCDGVYKAWEMVRDLVADLPTAQLTQSGKIRVVTWTLRACPRPDENLPNAYPNLIASKAVAADVTIELDYRPGATWNGSAFVSHNRNGGVCNIWNGSSYVEMKTTDGDSGTGNPPLIFNGSQFVNQKKIGQE